MTFTVKQLASMAGVSVRTLHYYDEIGLLAPSYVGENGYRYYEEDAVLRLQQVLFYRELGLSLQAIGDILDLPGFDVLAALQAHRGALEAKIGRMRRLVKTIDSTILYLTGEADMSNNDMFEGFTPEDEQKYEQEARERWGDEEVGASYKRWNSYSKQKQQAIKEEGRDIYLDMAAAMESGPESPEVQAILARWHQHMRYFYEPSIERLRGLGQLYVDHPEFARNFRAIHPDLPEFMQKAINYYCDELAKNAS